MNTKKMACFLKLQPTNKFVFQYIRHNLCSKCVHKDQKVTTEAIQTVIPLAGSKDTHVMKFKAFLDANPHILSLQSHIPDKYKILLRRKDRTRIYLIAPDVAKKVVSYVLPELQANPNQLIAVSNPGLGLIPSELLAAGIAPLRLYESSSLFQDHLNTAFADYGKSVKIFSRDILALRKSDNNQEADGSQVEKLLEGIPKKNWDDSPALTIIGSLTDKTFIYYLIKSLALQEFVVSFGRIQMFVFMRADDYIVCTIGVMIG